ncbi:MAG: tetratricopeptide repeat protein [Blastochloris sp.]|nr:tetratricopeptide repeat protein [Blastochloris sp.]
MKAARWRGGGVALERVLKIQQTWKKEGRGDDVELAAAWYEWAWYQQSMARYAEAETSFQQALRLRESLLGRRDVKVAECLNGLGVVNENLGRFDLSEQYYEEALVLREDLLGKEDPATLTTRNNLATLYWSRGNYAEAERFFREVYALRKEKLGSRAPATMTSLNNLALLARSMGDYVRAERLFQQVLSLRESVLGPEHTYTLTTLHQLGLLYADLRKPGLAEPLLLRAERGRQKVAGAEHPDTARSRFHLAWFYDRFDRYAEAEPLHQQALATRLRVLGEEHPETAGSYAFLARHYHLQGRWKDAELYYERALRLQTKILGIRHPDTLKTVEGRACLALDQGDRRRALLLMREAMGVRESMLQDLFSFTTEAQRIDFQQTLNLYQLPGSLGEPGDLARILFRTKGLVLDSLLEDQAGLRTSDDPKLRELVERLQVVSKELIQKQLNSDGDEVEKLRGEQGELQAALTRRVVGSGRARRSLSISVEAVRRAIPSGEILVEWLRYESYDGNLKSSPWYGVLIVPPLASREPLRWVPVGEAKEVDALILKYQQAMRRRVSDEAMKKILRSLFDRLCQPILNELSEEEKLKGWILCPDASLNFLSFATLLDEKGVFWGKLVS